MLSLALLDRALSTTQWNIYLDSPILTPPFGMPNACLSISSVLYAGQMISSLTDIGTVAEMIGAHRQSGGSLLYQCTPHRALFN